MNTTTLKFSDIKDQLQRALEQKLQNAPILGEKEGFTLIEGFMSLSVSAEIQNNLIIGGPNIPTVGLVGKTSGRIYTFALKAVLPDIKI